MSDNYHDQIILIPGPSFHVDLSSLDACHPLHYSRRLLIFKCASDAQRSSQLNALKTGLQALVNRCPLLAGIIAPLPPDAAIESKPEWRTVLPHPDGLELIVKDLRGSMPSFEELEATDFPGHAFPYGKFMPIPEDLDLSCRYPACKVQFSAINGGSIFTFSMSHSVADGTGTDELMRILAQETRLAQEQEKMNQGENDSHNSVAASSFAGEDRSPTRNIKSDAPFRIEDHPAYRWKSTSPANTAPNQPHPFQATSPEIPVIIRVPASGLAQLKLDAATPKSQRISTHDALCALMWRSVVLLRSRRSAAAQAISHSFSSKTELFMPSDARRHLHLPLSYVGNAVYQLTAPLELSTLLSPSGLQDAAAVVRRAINAVTPSVVTSYMAEINRVGDAGSAPSKPLDWQFMKPDAFVTGLGMGTCMASGELIYGGDWGGEFGPVMRFRLVSDVGTNAVLPKLLDGSVEVMLSVLPEEVEALRGVECFGKYIDSS